MDLVDTVELKKARCQAGYFTSADMARAMGMKRTNYGNRERGIVPFSADEIVKMCALLGISLEDGMKLLT
jgi:transcriptional regulator with XRE-family HTH domain